MPEQARLIAVTGASGFLGRALVPALLNTGWRVMSLGRTPPQDSRVEFHAWRLGEPLPAPAESASWVVHLACATLVSAKDAKAAAELDLDGTMIIARQLRALRSTGGDKHRLLFVSSQSSSPKAGNVYGQQKWRLEQALGEAGEVIVRPGLIYADGEDASVYSGVEKLVRALPVLPDVGRGRSIQPIHVDDLADAMARIVSSPAERKLWRLGEADPAPFSELVRQVARARGLRAPLVVPFPAGPLLGLMRYLPLLGGHAERALGLNALRPMPTRRDLARLGMTLRPWGKWRRIERRRRIREARALIRAVAGRHASSWATRRMVRWLEGPGADLKPLSPISLRWPGFVRLLEPFGASHRHVQLNAAMAIQEVSSAGQAQRFSTRKSGAQTVGAVMGLMAVELLAMPVRLMATFVRPR